MQWKKTLFLAALLGASGSAMAIDPFYAVCDTCGIATPTPDGSATDPDSTLGVLEHLRAGGHWTFASYQVAWVCNANTANAMHDGSGCATYTALPGGGWIGSYTALPDNLCKQVFVRDQASAPCSFPDPGDTWHGTAPIGFTFDVFDQWPALWCMGRLGCTSVP
jgi:hypothetical protein